MVDWADRVREVITLISPSETEFEARWRGNPISITNKTGVHEFGGISGARTQDQGAGPKVYQLTLYFDGPQSDLEASGFVETWVNEIGNWRIIHPVKGPVPLTKTGLVEDVQPVTSGGLTVVETNWIEPLPESEAEQEAQLQAEAAFQATQLNETATSQYEATAKQDTPGQRQSIIDTIGKSITSIKQKLKLVENFAILDPRIDAIAGAIENTLAGDIIDTSLLAGQMQRYVQIFGLGQVNTTDAVTMYEDFVDDILNIVPLQPTQDNLSAIASTELVAMAGVAAAGQMSLIGGIQSRQQAVTTAQKVAALFADTTQRLDEIQTLYQGNPIDLAYFSQSDSFGDAYIMSSLATKFLVTSVFALPAERTIVLREDKAVPQIAKDEYGNIGDDTSEIANIQKLITSNQLCGDDIYWLPAGRQVLIYQ